VYWRGRGDGRSRSPKLELATMSDDHRRERSVARVCREFANRQDMFYTVNDPAEYPGESALHRWSDTTGRLIDLHMLPRKVLSWSKRQEPLTSIRVCTSIRHDKQPVPSVSYAVWTRNQVETRKPTHPSRSTSEPSPPVPLRLVKSPPCIMKPSIILWTGEPL
jgi:hypothetical protein